MDQRFEILVYTHGVVEPAQNIIAACIAETLNACTPTRDHTSADFTADGTPCETAHRVTGTASPAAITIQIVPND